MKVLVAGGTGFLGTYLVDELIRRNHEVIVLSRKNTAELGPRPYRHVAWPLRSAQEIDIINQCDALINLAGEPIFGARWTRDKKNKIKNSRAQFTRHLTDLLRSSLRLKVFLNASAIGFYGDRKTELLTEQSPSGEGFLAGVCKEWETAAMGFHRAGLRTVLMRTGIVLCRTGGLLAELEPLYRAHMGGPSGSGSQYMSWIHVEDWVRAAIFCLENSSASGAVNFVAPESMTNRSFSHIYGELFHQRRLITTPTLALKIALGEMASLVLDSQNVRPEKLLSAGFMFKHPYLKDALWELYEYEKQGRHVNEFYERKVWIAKAPDKMFHLLSTPKNVENFLPEKFGYHWVKQSTESIMSGSFIDWRPANDNGGCGDLRIQIKTWRPPTEFSYVLEPGPLSIWDHHVLCQPLKNGALITDRIHFQTKGFWPLRLLGARRIRKSLFEIFTQRDQVLDR